MKGNADFHLECIGCGADYDSKDVTYACRKCGDLLNVKYDYEEVKQQLDLRTWRSRPMSVWRYEEVLPVHDSSKRVSLGEGGTGLHECQRLGEALAHRRVYVKNEGENPTGSFKDRGMTVGVTRAVELGAKKVICASTGNTSASLAAYAAKASLESIVLVPSGRVALGKLSQAIIHGARVVQVVGGFDDALRIVVELASSNSALYLLNSVNPYRLEGQKTLAYEIFEQLDGSVPDNVVVPVGNAGNISAIWKGFVELEELGVVDRLPRMIGIQAEGASPIAKAFKQGLNRIRPSQKPETIATAVRIGSPVNWKKALMAARQSGGLVETVTDREVLEAQRRLAMLEGIFTEPAGGSPVAGLAKLLDMGLVDRSDLTVCVATGHGLKDPGVVQRRLGRPVKVDPSLSSLRKAIALG